MLEGWEKLAEQLDRDKPRWWAEWANQDDLRDLAINPHTTVDHIRARVAMRIFHSVLNAAVAAGLVEAP